MTKRFVTSEIETHVFESGPHGVCEFKTGLTTCGYKEHDIIHGYKSLPADWNEDSSLETWFPLTAEALKQKTDLIAQLTKQLEESENGKKRWEKMFYELFEEKVFHENHCTLVDENIALVEERDALHVIIEEFWTAQAKDHHACGCDEWPECVHSLNAYELRSRAMNLIAARPSTISKSNSA
jgi:hypothetical protein